ncbi:hypothetical protein U9M48_016577 [Paspalum notatum var. saurae]|uniref:Uncharacterized protein n=1 Tax=Paspalum notatum var. saurae TaxID=547442 RepID=A0AAQ3T5P8_PASNO
MRSCYASRGAREEPVGFRGTRQVWLPERPWSFSIWKFRWSPADLAPAARFAAERRWPAPALDQSPGDQSLTGTAAGGDSNGTHQAA